MADVPDDVQRWTAKRRVALVLSILRGETSVAEAARKHGLTVAEVEEWQERFLAAAENALRARPKGEDALKDEQIKKLKQKGGELGLDVDILREAAKGRPTDPTTSGGGRQRGGTRPTGGRWCRARRCGSGRRAHAPLWWTKCLRRGCSA